VTRLVVSPRARRNLRRLTETHSLPPHDDRSICGFGPTGRRLPIARAGPHQPLDRLPIPVRSLALDDRRVRVPRGSGSRSDRHGSGCAVGGIADWLADNRRVSGRGNLQRSWCACCRPLYTTCVGACKRRKTDSRVAIVTIQDYGQLGRLEPTQIGSQPRGTPSDEMSRTIAFVAAGRRMLQALDW
jgi:hypothetical protein